MNLILFFKAINKGLQNKKITVDLIKEIKNFPKQLSLVDRIRN